MSARSLALLRPTPDTLRDRIVELGGDRRSLRAAVLSAACVHAGLVWLIPAPTMKGTTEASRAFAPVELIVERSAAPPPATTAAPREEQKPLSRARSTRPQPNAKEPEVAQAGAVLTQAEPLDAPLDLTDTVVTGVGVTDPGGATSGRGTSEHFSKAVRLVPATHENSTSTAANNAGSGDGPDQSQGPSVVGGLSWDCPFPADADVAGVNRARVALRVEVDVRGRPSRVIALSDPGHGFAEAARSCALRKHWLPGTDERGRPIAAGITLNVRFVR